MTDEEKKREEENWQLTRDYKQTFTAPEGKRVYENLIRLSRSDECIVPMDSMNRIDPLQVMFNEGRRSVIVHIQRKLKENLGKPKQTEAIKE